ncbi:unnamed protein product [Vitrella brassicaformis CCMP3155]|uniref:Charged multivesicular body protein 1a n=2 Tax=Vitrella brassicaformis TaxID=1169539 RepID=A0A0G4H1Q7_VITBC|nr:unnamed protein product [Vitrella brassicaformis CCMP3155]|eukprot:CEM37554.1 unnamed protein product [Vitrella brassicaformis CCMP3155]
MGNRQSIEDNIFNMKLKSKELTRMSAKAEKEEKEEKTKVKKAIEKGNKDGARIYAQNAIRKKHEALNYLKLSSKMDAAASRLDAAIKSQQMTKDIYKAVPGLSRALGTMNVERISTSMDAFEKLFEDLDVRAEYVTNAIDSTTASATPVDQVDQLIAQVAEEHALDVSEMLSDAPQGNLAQPAKVQNPAQQQPADPLQERLNNLRT